MSTEAALRLSDALLEAGAHVEDQRDVHMAPEASVPPLNCRSESDEHLLESVSTGSKDALSALFLRHGRAVLHIAWRILRDDAEAADLRQDVFISVFQNTRLFDPTKGSASSWIMQIAYRRAIDRRRYLANRQHYDAPIFDEHQSPVGNPPPSTDQIDGKAILGRLRKTLSVDQRETLELHLFEGYSLREIAEKKGQSLGNVRHHYYRALERLRSQVFARKRE
jgi:RNA polymerase sigma-70 factor (ECF subfamily)